MVFATQNPIEQEEPTLPEAQLDRFMLMINVSYPKADEEIEIVRRTTVGGHPEVRSCALPLKKSSAYKNGSGHSCLGSRDRICSSSRA